MVLNQIMGVSSAVCMAGLYVGASNEPERGEYSLLSRTGYAVAQLAFYAFCGAAFFKAVVWSGDGDFRRAQAAVPQAPEPVVPRRQNAAAPPSPPIHEEDPTPVPATSSSRRAVVVYPPQATPVPPPPQPPARTMVLTLPQGPVVDGVIMDEDPCSSVGVQRPIHPRPAEGHLSGSQEMSRHMPMGQYPCIGSYPKFT